MIKNIDEVYQKLKNMHCENLSEDSFQYGAIIKKYGYLPIPFDLAQEKLSDLDVFLIFEAILLEQGTMVDGHISGNKNPLSALKYNDTSWIYREQLKIETLCLSGLCSSNQNLVFRNYLLKIITTPKGNKKELLPATAFYLLPFYRRDPAFSSAYCPLSVEVDSRLCDEKIKEKLGWDQEFQLQIFLHLCQLAGHPILIDLLPQAGRFSKTVFADPECFLWNDLQLLADGLNSAVLEITAELGLYGFAEMIMSDICGEVFEEATNIQQSVLNALRGTYEERRTKILKDHKFVEGGDKGVSHQELKKYLIEDFDKLDFGTISNKFSFNEDVEKNDFKSLYEQLIDIDFALDKERARFTTEQLLKNKQDDLIKKVKSLIQETTGKKITSEADITDKAHQKLIDIFIKNDLWPISGGSWNSCGYPIFRKMSPEGYPISDHYNYQGNLVTAFSGDMDIISPWHFASPHNANENNNINHNVIERYVEYSYNIYSRFEPNGFRLDHVDHCADYPVSINESGNSISYRAPLIVFSELAKKIQKHDPTFALLAEYMGWGDDNNSHLYKEYSQNNIDAAISLDIVGEYRQNVRVMLEETNQKLVEFNKTYPLESFTLTHVFDNHDRSHPDILRALSEFTEKRALLKWVKCLFLPGGEYAKRSTIYLDGNQTHTPNKNFTQTFLKNEQLQRNNNMRFFTQFTALYRYSLTNEAMMYGESELLFFAAADEKSNNAISAWLLTFEEEAFIVVANEYIDDNTCKTDENEELTISIPLTWKSIEEVVLPEVKKIPENWLEIPEVETRAIECSENIKLNLNEKTITFQNLNHNDFYICKCC